MKRILMNKNTPVYILEYSESAKGFTKVYETLNEEYEKILNQYQNISLMSKTNIQGECAVLNFQIHRLDKYISEKYNTLLKYDCNNKYFKDYTFKDLYGKNLT